MTDKAQASASTRIAAPPEVVYALVTDLTRMGEWSPEATGGGWVGGATGPAEGAKFKGTNANGDKTWSATVTVTEATPARRFAFRNGIGPVVFSEWAYDIAPVDGGAACEVTESWQFGNAAPVLKFLGPKLTGVQDRVAHTQTMIEATLAKVKETAESGG